MAQPKCSSRGLPLAQDLILRSIAHHIERQKPVDDEEALAFARTAARALGYTWDDLEWAAENAVRVWHDMYGGVPVNEKPGMTHDDYFTAARIQVLQDNHPAAQTYLLMALYDALMLPGYGVSIGEDLRDHREHEQRR